MIYGYSEKIIEEEYELLQMREVTFAMAPDQLRLVAKFLLKIADDIQSGVPFLHRHIEEVVPEWRLSVPQVDIVAMVPNQIVVADDDKE